MMRVAIWRVVLLGGGLALLMAALLTTLARPVGAAPAMLVTETPTKEPATRTPTPPASTNTPVVSTNTPVASTSTPAPTATDVPNSGGNSPPPSSTPTATATPIMQIADPAITKSVNIGSARVGDSVEFTISATNLGGLTATNVVVEDTLPSFLALEGVSATRGNVSVSGSTVRVEIGDLAPGEVVTITIRARVIASAAPPNNSNLATIASDSSSDDPANNSSSVSLLIDQPPASLPNTGDPGAPLLPALALLGLLMIGASLLGWRQRV